MKTVNAWAIKQGNSVFPFYVERTRSECITSAIKWAHGEILMTEKRSTVWARLKRKYGIRVVPVQITEVTDEQE